MVPLVGFAIMKIRFLLLGALCASAYILHANSSPCFRPEDRDVEGLVSGRRFELILTDPLNQDSAPESYDVIQLLDKDGLAAGYRMNLITGVCPRGICEVMHVTVYWDVLGNFDRLEPYPDSPLSKQDNEVFTTNDYTRLSRILKNKRSILKEYTIEWFVKEKESQEETDGVSGATDLSAASEVVEGAAYTTWVLWHWVNGEVVEQLQERTRQSETPKLLQRLLLGGQPEEIQYAVERLKMTEEGLADPLEATVFRALQTADNHTARLLIHYLGSVGFEPESLHVKLAEAAGLSEDNPQREIMAFLQQEKDLSAAALEILAKNLPDFSYMGVHIALSIFERYPELPEAVAGQVERLTQSGNAFIARRAREHMNQQTP